MTSTPRILVYLLRRDLRLADNPVLHEVAKVAASPDAPFTHLLPLYVFSCAQIEVSGFLRNSTTRSPFPEARSPVAGFWRCGPHRATFLAESVWELKSALGTVGSGLEIRVGRPGEIVREVVEGLESGGGHVVGVWMTNEEGQEEKEEERDIQEYAKGAGKEFRRFLDEKYLVDECVPLREQLTMMLYSPFICLPPTQSRSAISQPSRTPGRVHILPQVG